MPNEPHVEQTFVDLGRGEMGDTGLDARYASVVDREIAAALLEIAGEPAPATPQTIADDDPRYIGIEP